MSTIEQGTCDICKDTNVPVSRHYHYWDSIKCNCCSPVHFDIIRYCKNCKPVPSTTTSYVSKGNEYRVFLINDMTVTIVKI